VLYIDIEDFRHSQEIIMFLHDRRQAGRMLAEHLDVYANNKDAIVLALPRGGVPVAYEIARRLHLPLDVYLVRKLGMPGQQELAIGAIASGGVRVLNEEVLGTVPLSDNMLDEIAAKERQELRRREQAYRDNRPSPSIKGRIILLVDDGIATGATMRAAIKALRSQSPRQIIVAAPVAPPGVEKVLSDADSVICLMTPAPFFGVGYWYEVFDQTSDEEVQRLLNKAAFFTAREAIAV
jgi:putative phosphoribosyl transferase